MQDHVLLRYLQKKSFVWWATHHRNTVGFRRAVPPMLTRGSYLIKLCMKITASSHWRICVPARHQHRPQRGDALQHPQCGLQYKQCLQPTNFDHELFLGDVHTRFWVAWNLLFSLAMTAESCWKPACTSSNDKKNRPVTMSGDSRTSPQVACRPNLTWP